MNSKKWLKSSTAMILASLVVASGAAVVTTNVVETNTLTASAISIHEFQIKNFKASNPKGGSLRIDSPIKFTADLSQAMTNYNSYTSAYITIKKNGVEQTKLNYNISLGDQREDTWIPTVAGTYTAELYVVDYYGNYGSSTISFYVNNPGAPQVTTINAVPVYGDRLKVGNTMRFDIIIQEGGELFTGVFTSANIVIKKQGVTHATLDYKNGKNTFNPREQGKYTATLQFSTPSGRSVTRAMDFDVAPRESDVCVDSFTATTPSGKYCVGVPVKFDYKVSNCYINSYGRYSYAAVRIFKNGKEYTSVDVNADVDPSKWTWTPTETGYYVFEFDITDGYRYCYATYSIGVNVTAGLSATASVSKTAATLGQTLTLSGKGANGAGNYRYAFAYRQKSGSSWGAWKSIKGYSTTASTTFKPTAAGTYQVRVQVKDANGTVVTKTYTVTVSGTLYNKSTVSATKVKVNKAVTVTGKASGGAGSYQYAVYYKLSSASSYTTARGYSATATTSVKFTKAGTYTVLVKVKDKNGMVVNKTMTVSVTK